MINLIKFLFCCLTITALSIPAFAAEEESTEGTQSEEIQAPAPEEELSE